jgi:DNA-binding HxlR family transcriptional regulator
LLCEIRTVTAGDRFRYAQFCPLARATEILGQRWTLLILRELAFGPRRFSDIQRPLAGVSSSVLASRLEDLEARDIVRSRTLPPPAAARVYELTDSGAGLIPALVELTRWGARFLDTPQPGDHIEPGWLRLGLFAFASRRPSPRRSFNITVRDGEHEVALRVAGGRRGTVVEEGTAAADATIRAASPLAVLALASARVAPADALRAGLIEAEGDLEALEDFPSLFEMQTQTQSTEKRQGD